MSDTIRRQEDIVSHFIVTVAVTPPEGRDVEEVLAELMAPYDEGLEMPEYRDYATGDPKEHVAFWAVKQAAQDLRDGTGIKPYEPDSIGISSEWSKETPEQQAAEIRRKAALYDTVPAEPTWADIVSLKDRLWPDEAGTLLLEQETGRAYEMSTYNPESKWDFWRIGGRWGGYFRTVNSDARAACSRWAPERDWDSPAEFDPGAVDGGRRADFDFDAMRAAAVERAEHEYDLYEKLIAGTPEAMSWPQTHDMAEAKAATLTGRTDKMAVWDEARESYRAQPRVQALEACEELGGRFGPCPIHRFSRPRPLYVEFARARAVPGFATLTADGRWMAKGRMGWFGASNETESSEIGYLEAANAYLDTLGGDTYLFALDCHI